jgi:hypothetical protein
MTARKSLFLTTIVSFILSIPATFGDILITEIMYNASGPDTGFEWVEIYNSGDAPVDLTGWKLSDEDSNAVNWSLMSGSLNPGQAGIITLSTEADFKASWPTAADAVIFTSDGWGSIANTVTLDSAPNEQTQILDETAQIVDLADYYTEAPWPTGVNGSSIYLLPNFINPTDNDNGSSWAESTLGVDGAINPLGSGTYAIGNIGSPGYVMLVPEPSAYALALGVITLVGLMIRRRRR